MCNQRFVAELMSNDRLLSGAQEMLGSEDVVLLSSTFFTKYPTPKEENKKGKFIGWHQDLKYWGLLRASAGEGSEEAVEEVTAWIAIDEVTFPLIQFSNE